MRSSRFLLGLIFMALISGNAMAQAPKLIATIPASNQYPITFTDLAQRTITLEFDQLITTLSTTAGWTITVNGVSQVLAGPALDPTDHHIIKFQIPAGITYANRLTVFVTYNQAAAAPKLAGAGGNVASFGPTQAVNNLVLNCNAFDVTKFDYSLSLTQVCAPAHIIYSATYYILSNYVNSINYNPSVITVRTDWNDGTGFTEQYGAEVAPGSGKYAVTFDHTFPNNPNVCYWSTFVYPGVGGVSYCFGGGLNKNFVYENHAKDNLGDGILRLNTDTIKVCLGQNFSVIFNDATYFNCNPLTVPDHANKGQRNIQFAYGTNFAAGARISNVLIDGATQTLPYSGSVQQYDSIRSTGVPAPSGWYNTSVLSHAANLGTDAVGQIFELELQNWNPCNPWDIFSTYAPITHYAYIKIVDGPIAEAGAPQTICANGTATMAGLIQHLATAGSWSTKIGDGAFVNPTQPTGAIYTPGPTDKTRGFVWLTLTATSPTPPCNSHQDSVKITIDPIIANNIVAAAQSICINTNPAALTGSTPTGGAGAGTYTYQWQNSLDNITFNNIGGATLINYSPGALAVTTWYRRIVNSGPCTNISASIKITVNPDAAIARTSAPGTDAQTPCINTAITNITYSVTGGGTGAGVVGLPAGVTGAYAAGVFTISGTPTIVGTYNYTVTTTGTCVQKTANGTITVKPDATIARTSPAGTDAQSLCINTAITNITYSVGGGGTGAGVVGLPAGVTGAYAAGVFTISGTPTASGSFSYTVTTTGTCVQKTANGTITVNPDAAIARTSAAGTDAQTPCINTAITNITYSVTGGGTGAGVVGLPAGVTGAYAAGVFTISGTPTVVGTYNYTITTTGTCVQKTATGSITVKPDATVARTSPAGTDAQSLCINTAITNITYSVGGGGTGAGVVGLPAGVTGAYAAGVFTISGTPTASGTFNYTVTTTGTCVQKTATGSITVNPDAAIARTSAAGTDAQTPCINTAITNITYSVTGGGTGAGVVGLPAGVTGAYAAGVFTISGTPTVVGTYNYTVTTTGTCVQKTATGSITVKPDATIARTSPAGTDAQSLCINTAITNITYSVGGGGTGAGVVGLPAGVTGAYAAGVFTISGTPTASGTFNYTVTTTGTCIQKTALGSITVKPDAAIARTSPAGTDNQTVCINTAIANITYSVTGGGTGAGVVGLPAGVTGAYAAGVFTISGTPTASGTFNYTVTTTGTCVQKTATGTIKVDALPTANAGVAMAAICQGGTSGALGGSVGGSATGGTWSTPAGGTFNPTATTLNATWTPPAGYSGTATLTLTTSGGSCVPATASKNIVVNPTPTVIITNPAPVCAPATVDLTAAAVTAGSTPGLIFTYWKDAGATIPLGAPAAVNVSGTYYIKGTSAAGCFAIQPVVVIINPGKPAVPAITIGVTPVCQSQAGVTYGVVNDPTVTSYTWNFDAGLNVTPVGPANQNTITVNFSPTSVSGNVTVTASNGCGNNGPSGPYAITVNQNAAIALISAAGTDAQTPCINTAITNIRYSVTGGGTGAGVVGLPAGVTGAYAAGVFTISGTPTVTGTFNYTVTTTGFCIQATATGTITVKPDATIALTSAAGTDAQTPCINTAITNITYSVGGGGTGAGVVGLPAGVNGAYAAGVFTISGTPTVVGTYNYTVTTTGTCVQKTATGSITVKPDATIARTSPAGTDAQSLCINTAITNITYSVGGGGTGAGVVGLPAGVTGAYAAGVFTISGIPTASGTFNYTVTTTGTCVQKTATGSITVNPDAAIARTSAAGTDAQTLCINNAITNITYSVTGGGTGAGVVGLPAGVTGVYAAGVFTISGTPTASGTFNYTITTTGTCVQKTATGSITVKPDASITLTSAAGTDAQTPCINTAITSITYSVGGGGTGAGVVGLPAGVTGAFAAGVFTISGTPTVVGTYNYTVTTTGTCVQKTATGSITVKPDATIARTSPAGTDAQTLCINNAITNITYSVGGGGTGAGVVGLPAGVTGAYAAGVFTISGTPTASGTFAYTVTTTGTCIQKTAAGSITVNPDASITLTSAAGTDAQTPCINTVITSITYSIGGGGTGAGVVGLPAGVTGAYFAGVFTISGTPTVVGTFNYTVTTTGTCVQKTATGSITVKPDASIALTSAAGTDAQTPCINTVITNITYSVGGGGTGAGVVGLPAGVTGAFAAGVFTISGTPTASGTFNYTVTTTGTCVQKTATGSITVKPDASISRTSPAGTDAQTLCINNAITNITYSVGGGGTGAGVVGLPAGVTGAFAAGVFTISGTPTASGTFNYTVTTTGTCVQKTATGTITVNPDAAIARTSAAGTDAQTPCINTAITNITYSVTGGGTGAGVVGLPAGVTGAYAAGVFTISGTPTVVGTFNYTVTTTGTCIQKTATGSITVKPDAAIVLTSAVGTDVQTPCINTVITNITYSITGGGTGAGVVGLPAGVTGAYAAGVFTISGTPTVVGTFNYTVTTTGTCVQKTATGSITVKPDASIALTSAAGTDAQTPCINTVITNITYSIGGGGTGAGVIGLPAGVTGAYAAGVFTISGTPTASGTFNYTVTTTGTCIQKTATGSITVKPDAAITLTSPAGSDNQTVCISTAIANIIYSVTGGGTGAGVVGLPAGVTGAYAAGVFTISGTPTASGTFNYTITTTGTCVQKTATGTIKVDPLPTVNAGAAMAAICQGGTSGALGGSIGGSATGGTWSTPAGGTFNPTATTLNATWTPPAGYSGTATLTLTTSGGSCVPATASKNIVVNPTPTLIITNPAPVCAPGTADLTAAAVTAGSTPGLTFTYWTDAGATLPYATPSTAVAGTYYIKGTTAAGCFTINPVTVTVVPLPTTPAISGGGKTKMCKGTSGQFYSVPFNAGHTYTWTVSAGVTKVSGGNATDNFIVLTFPNSGTFTLTVQEFTTVPAICGGPLQSLTLTVYDPPVADAGLARTICAGDSTILGGTPTASGGSGNFTYLWIPSIGLDDATKANPKASPNSTRTFTLNVTDTTSGCASVIKTVVVTVNPLPSVYNVSGPAYYCFGTAGVTVTLSGSQVGVNYQLYKNAAVQGAPVAGTGVALNWTNMTTGTYTVKATNATSACTLDMNGSLTVAENPNISISSITAVEPSCNSYNDGVIIIAASGGTGALSYSINNGATFQSSNTFGGLLAASYNIVVKDTRNCTKDSVQILTQPTPVSITSLTVTNPITCYGGTNGSAKVVVTGGTPNAGTYNYQWYYDSGLTSPIAGQTSDIAAGLAAGTFWVKASDLNSCWVSGSITLTQPAVLSATFTSSNITCFGANDGKITISFPTGGSGTYEYTVNGGGLWQVSGNFINLAAGNYNVQIRDAAHTGCVIIINPAVSITAPAVLSATVTSSNVTCFGANNGTITISGAAGGYGTYQYSVNGGTSWQGTGIFTNLAPASYNVQIRDAANTTCVITLNPALAITQPAVLSATVNKTNVTCFGSSDGTITLSSPLGGSGTYEYTINGGGSWQASGSFTALGPGSYNVQIRDAAHTSCVIVLNNSLSITQPAVLNAGIVLTMVTCNGANDGIISITAPTGGSGTYGYTINGGTTWQASGLFNGLAPGSYDVRIRDAANIACVVILNNGVNITEPAILNGNVVISNITCFGANDGIININSPSGGYGTYEYSINGGGVWQASGNFPGLTAGVHDVRIRDKAHTGCFKVLNGTATITEPAVLNAVLASTNVTCNGAGDGTITISGATGGYGTYQYTVNGGVSWQGSGNFINLTPATYNVEMRDAANPGCVKVLNAALVITQPVVLSATVVKANVTCFGAADGTITINGAAGGSGAYEYTINGGAAWQASGNFTALTPGFYNVKIRDAAHTGCIITLIGSLSVTEPGALNASVAKTNVTCKGAADGTITISAPTGGYGTYQYSINGGTSWQGTGNYSGLAPASYDVRIRDGAQTGCVITLNPALVITEPAVLSATLANTNVSCFGANNGIITITGTAGGYGTYEYTINGGTTWVGLGTFTNLAPATYDVRIRDAAHIACMLVLNPALVITQPAVLSATVAHSNVSCFGTADGTITVSAPLGGYGTYEYSVNGGGSWQASGSFTALGPGNYNVQIRDAAHPTCVIVLNNALTITQPSVLNAVVTPTMVTCNGANDGIIAITAPTGGSGTYGYSINGGTTWQASGTFSALSPASYDVRIRDGVNTSCVIILNSALSITEPAVISASVSSSNVSCFGANDATITISSPTGGYGTYEYTINGGTTWQTSANYSGLVPATYNVEIRDKAHVGCVKVLNAALVITAPAVLNAAVASTNVTCNGAANGTITISAPTGGYGTYQFTVNGGATWQGSGNFTGLAPATYNVRIRDAAHIACEIVLNPALVITQPAVLSATVAKTNVTCFGAADGTINITSPLGGYGTYEYTISGGTTWQASGNFTALTAGFYNVQIRDAANTSCVVTLNGSLQITEPAVLAAVVARTNVTCKGANDGTITISSPTGGYGTYQYTINGGGSWQASGSFASLAPGNYNVEIRDAAHTGCVIVLNAALAITEPAVLNATVASTNVTCFGAANGTITITLPTGGYGTYQYTVNGGTSWQGSGTFTSLAPASYNVKIRDAANTACVVTLNAALVITQPAVLSATVNKTNVTCFGAADGTITISSPLGGYGTYEYSVNGGGSWQASGSFINLGPGSYNVQIRDKANTTCVIVLNNSLSVTQPAVLNAVVTPAMVTCKGANDGIIAITLPTGGYGTYQYTINGGTTWQASGTFSGLAPATYDVRIRDAANAACVISLNPGLVITEPSVLNATVASTNVTCFGANNGTITISAPTGGYGTYEYTVNGGGAWQLTGNFSALTPGSYDVRIRDKAHTGCVIVLNPALVITQPAVLTAAVARTNVTCNGSNDGTISITAPAGGYGTYQYTVNGGATWQGSGSFTNLAPATYNVKIRDAANIACEIVLNGALVITQPAKLTAAVASTNVTCFGANDGTITLSAPAGGYGTYEYTVNGGTSWQASGNFTALAPGFYNVQIRDAANTGCVVILNGSLRITEPSVLSAFVSSTNVTCNGANDGTITISSPTGGYGTYQYSVNGGGAWQASGNFTNLTPASYNVQIRDAAHTGCLIVLNAALVITQPAVLNATVTPTMVSCLGANDGIITITLPTGGYGTYQYSVNGGTTWQGSGTFTNLAPANYNVQIRDASHTGCIKTLNPALAITQPAVLSATIASTNVTCFGGNDGTITISSPLGGYGTYEFSINGGGSWQASGNFTTLSPGSYNIMIRDAAHTGCVIVLNAAYPITQPPILSATVAKTDVTCNGANDGTITISSPSGGYGTYQYTINGGTSWQASGNFTGLVPGTYNVRMRDAANTACTMILYPNLTVNEPLVLTMTSTGNFTLPCFGDMTGSGTFYAAGGTLPYTFNLISNTTGGVLAAPGFNSQSFFAAGAGTITVGVTDSKGCTAQATIIISQPGLLTPGTIGSDQVLCNGDNPVLLTQVTAPAGGPAAYIYQWQYATNAGGPFINIAGANVSTYTPPAGATTTLYYRRMVTSGSCPPVYSNVIEILVNPKPVGILTGGETICPAQTSILKVNLPVGTGPFELDIQNYPGLTITGYVSDADINVTPAVTTTYKILRIKDANGCQVTSPSANIMGSATVTVRDLPAITVSPVNKTTCEFGMVTFNVTATGSDLTYQWYVDDGSGFVSVVDGGIYFGAQTSSLMLFGTTRDMNNYVYRAEVTGCSTTVTSANALLTVNTAPEILSQPEDSTICQSAGATFSVNAQGTGLVYQWQVRQGALFVNVVNGANYAGATTSTLSIINAPGTFNNSIYRVKISGICGVPIYSNFVVLRVNVPPTVTLNPVNKSVCDLGGPVYFSGNGSGMIDSLRWQVFNGGIWTDIYDDAIYSGTTSQQLTMVNVPVSYNGNQYRLALKAACATSYTNGATLTVHSNPVVDFTAVTPINACGGIPIVINGNPTGGSGTYTQHTWTGDVGPLSNYFVQSPTFNSQIAGTYNLNYKVKDSNGCTANNNVQVVVDAPDATFATDANLGCTPLIVNFTKDMTGLAKFWWDFGDGSPKDSVNANPTHTFTNINPGSIEYHDVVLKVRSAGGCFDTFTTTITVYPQIDASFNANKTVVCSGGTITFNALPGASKYFWDYGDGANGYATNVTTHLYTNLTTAPVVLTVKLTTTSFYNCTNSQTMTVTVMPVPLPQFSANPVSQIFNAGGNPVAFTNATNAGTWTWSWKFGDGGTSAVQDPSHTYSGIGSYNVTLIVNNANCTDSIIHPITVTPIPPVANFDSVPSACAPVNVNFNNTSLNIDVPGTKFFWDFGDGSSSTEKSPSYTYFTPGTYRITLTVTGPYGAQSVKSQLVSAYQSPVVSFSFTPNNVYVNDEKVRFFNLTQYADYYVWDFGDGDTSHTEQPFHKYMTEGVFDVTLHAYSSNGCMSSFTQSPGVTVIPAGVLRFSTVFTPNKTGPIDRTTLPTGGPEIDQFFFPPIRETVLDYKLQIFNRWGTLIFESHDINVPWNGYYKGKLCKQGVYVWFVEGKFANGKPFKKVGDVTLLQ